MLQLLKNKGLFSLEKIALFFMCLFAVWVVFPLKFLFFSSSVYQSGEFLPFLSHYLYAADICFLIGVFFCGLHFAFSKNYEFDLKNLKFDRSLLFLSSFFVFLTALSLFFSINLENSFLSFLRVFEFYLLYLLLIFEIVPFKPLIFTFLGAMFLSSLIGIGQFILHHSLGLKVLGESVISNSMVGVAKLDFFDFKLLRAYGTFAHPNIFAGFLLVSLVFSKSRVRILIFFVFLLAFLLTFSKTAFLAFLFLPLFLHTKEISNKHKLLLLVWLLILVVLALISEVSSLERMRFLSISWDLFWNRPFGVGLGNFTEAMSQFSYYKLFPWNYQPVHNIFLLALNEIGFAGFITLVLIFSYVFYEFMKKKEPIILALLFILVIVGSFDHYLFSLYQGQFLFWFIMAYVTCSHSGRLKHP